MRTDPTFWILARTTGLLAYTLLTASVLAGLVLKARPFGPALKAAAVTDIHRLLAMLGLGAVLVHVLALLLDTSVHFDIASLLVPGLAPYRPLWTGLGVLAAELTAIVYASFWLRKRIGTHNWRRLHWVTYLIFGIATMHGLAAGTDSGQPWAVGLYGGAVGAIVAAAGWRALVPPTKGDRRVSRITPVCVADAGAAQTFRARRPAVDARSTAVALEANRPEAVTDGPGAIAVVNPLRAPTT